MSNSCDQILHEKPKAKNIIAGDNNQSNIGEFVQHHSMQQLIKVPTHADQILDVSIQSFHSFGNPILE